MLGTKAYFRGTTQICAGAHTCSPVTVGGPPCLHGSSGANQVRRPQVGLQPVTDPLCGGVSGYFPLRCS